MNESNERGKRFESEVEECINSVVRKFKRSSLICQSKTCLNDGRTKIIDFVLRYRTISSDNKVGIECQDRERWDSSIIDKILAVRSNSPHNRFWYVYRDDSFLTTEALALLDLHGIMHFSFDQLQNHLSAIEKDLEAADRYDQENESPYEAPEDYARAVSVPIEPKLWKFF